MEMLRRAAVSVARTILPDHDHVGGGLRPLVGEAGGLLAADELSSAWWAWWSGQHSDVHLLVPLALLVAVLLLALVVLLARSPRRAHGDPKALFFALFEDRIRGEFQSQPWESMSTILTGVNSVLRASPESPCVLLLVSGPAAEATALRLARAVAHAVQGVLQRWTSPSPSADLELLGGSFTAPDDYWRLFESLSRLLDEQRVAVVRDLQDIHPRAAAAIAHLCDDTYPPFPQSVVVLLLSPGERLEAVEAEEAVVAAERCLVDCWLSRGPPLSAGVPPPAWASPEALPAVLGRLTGRALLVKPEPETETEGTDSF